MDPDLDSKLENRILHELNRHSGQEAVLTPGMFSPPIMLTNIFRIGLGLKAKGMTTGPDRRLGGWHLRLLDAGKAACAQSAPAPGQPTNRINAR